MKYEVIPLNKKFLLEKAELEKAEEPSAKFFFHEDVIPKDIEFFKIIAAGPDISINVYVGNLVTLEFYQPIGNINGKELFIADEKAITSRIIETKE